MPTQAMLNDSLICTSTVAPNSGTLARQFDELCIIQLSAPNPFRSTKIELDRFLWCGQSTAGTNVPLSIRIATILIPLLAFRSDRPPKARVLLNDLVGGSITLTCMMWARRSTARLIIRPSWLRGHHLQFTAASECQPDAQRRLTPMEVCKVRLARDVFFWWVGYMEGGRGAGGEGR